MTQTKEPKYNTVRRLLTLKPKYDTAKAAAKAAEVPDGDLPVRSDEPVTVIGYYEGTTKSGRRAWVHYAWVNGRLRDSSATYDLAAQRDYDHLSDAYGQECWLASEDHEIASEARKFGIEVRS
jgi:hypothetical protein